MRELPTEGPSLLAGLWHVHTQRTDGTHSLAEIFSFAEEHGFRHITLAEHVRREPTYDFDALYSEAKRRAAAHDISCFVGCEAKVLDSGGNLDASPGILDRADIVYGAFHGSAFERSAYLDAIQAMLANPVVDVWAHPFAYASQNGFAIEKPEGDRLIEAVAEQDVIFELNLRRPATEFVSWSSLDGVKKVIGYDLHDISNWTCSVEPSGGCYLYSL